jgi:hypothetical protein
MGPVWGKLIWPFTDKPSVSGPAVPAHVEPPADVKPPGRPKKPHRPAPPAAVEDSALLAATLAADAELAAAVLAEAVPVKAVLAEAAPPEPAPDAKSDKPKKPGRMQRAR